MFEQAFKNIDDVLWKEASCTTELDYTEQTSWLLFLKYLDGLPSFKEQEQIAKQFDALSAEIQRLARFYEWKLAALEALKKSLLHQAFTGQLH